MRLPSTVEQALAETERKAAWIRKRYPDMLLWANESYSSGIAFWSCVSMPFLFLSAPGLNSHIKVATSTG
jgi:hypothetical protein